MGFYETISIYYRSIIIFIIVCFISIALFALFKHIRFVSKNNFINRIGHFISLLIIVAPVSLYVGLRDINTGADTYNFWNSYISIGNISFLGALRYNFTGELYYLFSWIVSKVTSANVQIWFCLMAFVTLLFLVQAIWRWNLRYSCLALFIYYFCVGPNLQDQMRQMLAITIIIFSFQYLLEGKTKKFLAFVILAGLVHLTALMCGLVILVVYILSNNRNLVVWRRLIYWVAIFVATFFSSQVVEVLGNIISFGSYAEYFSNTSEVSFGWGLFLVMIPSIIPCFFMRKYTDSNRVMNKVIYVTVPVRVMGYVSYFVSRACFYFFPLNCIVLPYALERAPKNYKIRYLCLIYLTTAIYFILYCCWKSAEYYFAL